MKNITLLLVFLFFNCNASDQIVTVTNNDVIGRWQEVKTYYAYEYIDSQKTTILPTKLDFTNGNHSILFFSSDTIIVTEYRDFVIKSEESQSYTMNNNHLYIGELVFDIDLYDDTLQIHRVVEEKNNFKQSKISKLVKVKD